MAVACVTLKDPKSRATAVVAVGFGFNCFQFTADRGGQAIEVLWSLPNFAEGTARPSSSGIPILFPYPGRIAGGVLKWEGRDYQLPVTDGRGNAIHGFVLNRPWRVVEQSDNQVTGEFHAGRDDSSLLLLWPADFRIRVTYSLLDNRLACQIHIENPDTKPLPCGLGTHPYFRVPLGGARADDCLVQLPVTEQWELVNLLPTGRRLPVADAGKFQQGQNFGELKLDNVFTGLVPAGNRYKSTIVDPSNGTRVVQTFDRIFRECVVFTPPHREAICVEPYTCVPGCFDLAARGIDAGVRIVPPGGAFTAAVEIDVGV